MSKEAKRESKFYDEYPCKAIRKRVCELDLSYTDFAKGLKATGIGSVSIEAVRQWCNGYSRPDVDKLIPIAELLHCSLNYLFGKDEYASPDINAICEYTGLSEKAVNIIASFKPKMMSPEEYDEIQPEEHGDRAEYNSGFPSGIDSINKIIESEHFNDLVNAISGCAIAGIFLSQSKDQSSIARRIDDLYGSGNEEAVSLSRLAQQEWIDQRDLLIFKVQKAATRLAESIAAESEAKEAGGNG